MRNSDSLATIDFDQLAAVTGGCGKKKMQCPPPPPPQQAPAPQDNGGVDVTVATGAQAAQLIGGGAPQIQRA